MTLLLLSGPDWPAVGHPYGKHHGCGGLLVWTWVPEHGVQTCGEVTCRRCKQEHYAFPNRYAVDERNQVTDDQVVAELASQVPDAEEDVYPEWTPSEAYLKRAIAERFAEHVGLTRAETGA